MTFQSVKSQYWNVIGKDADYEAEVERIDADLKILKLQVTI